jgi:hypothetical protein
MLRRYWRAFSNKPPPKELRALLEWEFSGRGLYLYARSQRTTATAINREVDPVARSRSERTSPCASSAVIANSDRPTALTSASFVHA